MGKVTIYKGSIETDDVGVVYYEFQPYTQNTPVLVPEYDRNYAKDEARESTNVLGYIVAGVLAVAAVFLPVPGDEAVAAAAFLSLF